MAYTTPPTFADPWTLAKAHTNIRDNFDSIRRGQNSMWSGFTNPTPTTSITTVYSSPGIMQAGAPDEAMTLIVMVVGSPALGSAANNITLVIADNPVTQYISVPVPGTTIASTRANLCWCGSGIIAAGVNPSFQLQVKTSTGTSGWLFWMRAWAVPRTT